MFVEALLIIAAVAGFATAEVPAYFSVCGARNPKLDECVINSVSELTETLKNGIPELDIPPSEPFEIETMTLADLPHFKAAGNNVKIYGLPKYSIKHLHVDLEKKNIVIDLLLKDIRVEANFSMNANLLIPISGHGPFFLSAKDVVAKMKMTYKIIEQGGKQHLFFDTMQTKLDVKDFTFKFEAENIDKTLQEAFAQAIGNSHQEILETTGPYIEKAISLRCLELANKICKHFTYEELFPDRE